MAWWDLGDNDFLDFLAKLFGPQAESQTARGQAILGTAQKPADEVKTIVQENQAEALPSPSPSPTASPTPTPTASPLATSSATPAPTPKPQAKSHEDVLKDLADVFRSQQAQASPGRDPYALTPQSGVWEGKTPRRVINDPDSPGRRRVESGGDQVRTLSDVQMDPYRWNAEKAKKMQGLMENAGFNTGNGNIDTMAKIWAGLSQTAANFWQVGKRVSPLDILKRTSDGLQAAAPKSRTSTSTTISLTNAVTAEQLAHAALSQRLGRRATAAEVEEFKKALLAAEKKNPTTTTTTTTTDGSGNTSSSSTSKQGLNSSDFAVDWALGHNKDEAAAYQAAGIMIPWLFEALKAPV